MKKQAKVIMLPTEKASNLCITSTKVLGMYQYPTKSETGSSQHLYLTSDEEIKEGDWCILFKDHKNYLYKSLDNDNNNCYKIIATTDKSLYSWGGFRGQEKLILPQIPQSFIEAYVKADGKIDEVQIEYRRMYKTERGSTFEARDGECPTFNHTKEWQELKLREDNTVIIHNSKDKKYSRMDIIYAVTMVAQDMGYCKGSEEMKKWNDATTKWIEDKEQN